MELDKRQLARLEVAVKVRVALASHDEFSAHFTENLSGEGVFVRAVRPRPVGSNLDLEYVLADGTIALKARGVVRWTRTESEHAVGPPGMGVHLAAVDGPGRRFLADLLRSRGAAPASWMPAAEGEGEIAQEARAVVVRLPAHPHPEGDDMTPATIAHATASDLAGLTLPEHPEPPDAPAGAPPSVVVAPTPPTSQVRAPLGLVLDLAGADLLAGLVLDAASGPVLEGPTSLTPRLGGGGDGLKVKNAATWVPCLVPLAGLGWPSPTATLWARRFGLHLGAGAGGGVAIIVGGRPVPAREALASCLAELLEPYASAPQMPARSWVVLPAGATAAGEVVKEALERGALAPPTILSDAVVLASAAGAYDAGASPRLVVHTTLLETRATVVSGEGGVLAVRSALDTGLWRADDILADQIALRLSLTQDVERGDEQAFRRDLVAAVAAAREGQDPKVWHLGIGTKVHSLAEAELCELAHGASIRVLLACEEALAAAGVHQESLGALVLAADEPPWPGLADALGQGLGRAPLVAATHAWYRLERAAAGAGRSGAAR